MCRGDPNQPCWMCGNTREIEFGVPEKLWRQVVPKKYRHSPLCLPCFDACCCEAGILDWSPQIKWITFTGKWASFGLKVDTTRPPTRSSGRKRV
jgi:hypothetical protein